MARIGKKTYQIQDVVPDAKKVRIYYDRGANVILNYDSPFVELPAVPGTMNIILPDQVPVTDGDWTLGASNVDASGNESDIGAVISYPFDFIAPAAPTNGVIL